MDRFGAVEDPLTVKHHGAAAQVIPPLCQVVPESCVAAAIADLQAADAPRQLAALGEMAAKGATPVKHQHRPGAAGLISRMA